MERRGKGEGVCPRACVSILVQNVFLFPKLVVVAMVVVISLAVHRLCIATTWLFPPSSQRDL